MKQLGEQDISSDNSDFLISGKGNLVFNGNLRISGVFSGMLKLNGSLTVGTNASFTGDVAANDLTVFGQMVGSARVTNRAVFYDGSLFSGTLEAGEADFHEGCRISGTRKIGRISRDKKHETVDGKINSDTDIDLNADKMSSPKFKI